MGELAILGGKPVRTKPFPSWPVHDEKERKAVLEVLESGKWWYGEKVAAFERAYADYQDAKFGITCTSGTIGLEIALISCGVGAGDEVIVPPFTFVATATSVLKVNAIPIFVDIEGDTLNIDPGAIEAAITPRTKAIIPVHFAGLPADMDRINEIAKKHNLVVIEDACHSWGTKWRGKGTGALGHMGAFSFQMSKNITAGEGGIVLTDDEELADTARSYTNCGRGKGKPWYEHYLLGGNYRMTEFTAAILLCQLSRLQEQTERRMANAKILNEGLAEVPGIRTLKDDDPRVTQRSYHLYCLRLDSEALGGVTRERFMEAVRAEGVPVSPGYPHPLYKNPLFMQKGEGPKFCPRSCPYYDGDVDYTSLNLPECEAVCRDTMWLTQNMLLGSAEDMKDIVTAFRKVAENASKL